MARTLKAHSPGMARTIIAVPTGHFMHNPPWMARTIVDGPKPVRSIEVLIYILTKTSRVDSYFYIKNTCFSKRHNLMDNSSHIQQQLEETMKTIQRSKPNSIIGINTHI